MSAKRQADMAVIEAGLPANTLYIDGKPIMGPDNNPLTSGEDDIPSLAPSAVDDVSNIALKPNEALAREKFEYQKSQDALTAEEKQRLALQQQQQQQQSLLQQQKTALQAQVQRTVQASGRALNGFQNGIGSLSMPGGIGLPLATLLIMLMLLIPVNGRTRFSWLWGVVTGSAGLPSSIVSNGANGVITTTTNSDGSLTGSGDFGNGTGKGGGAPSVGTAMFIPSSLFLGTGVEGVQM